MMHLSLSNFLLMFTLLWGVNISLNVLGILKKLFPGIVRFDRPLDGGKYFFDKKRILGDSTTLLGLAIAVLWASALIFAGFGVLFASIVSFGVYTGHFLGSFVKRRISAKRAVYVPFVDHGDYVVFTTVLLIMFRFITPSLALACILVTYILHPIATLLAYRIGLREHQF